VTLSIVKPRSTGSKWAPQIVLVLDQDTRVLNINRGLAGPTFTMLATHEKASLHQQLHPECDGGCSFDELWKKAWTCLSTRDSVEWEVDDSKLQKLLRLNLSRPLTSQGIAQDRRRRHALLTITDITEHRYEYDSLIKREGALVRLLKEQGVIFESAPHDDTGATQTREMLVLADYGKKYRSLSRQVIMAQELERKRIATELHDGVAQSLGVIKYNVEASVARISRSDSDADLKPLEGVVEQITRLLDEVRRISNNLAPSVLDDFGLCDAVAWLCNEYREAGRELNPSCDTCIKENSLPDNVKIAAFRVIQEALQNIAKHSSASDVKVVLSMQDGGLQISIIDNGIGFDSESVEPAESRRNGGFGLRSMRDRVLVTGGEFWIDSTSDAGTKINASWSRTNLDLMSDETVLDGVDGNS
jgi:signal transduction histidine kinase